MPASRHSALVAAPPERVWGLVSDFAAWPRWLRAPYAGREVAPEGPPGPGCRFTMRGRLRYRLFARVTDWRPERRLAFEIYRSEYPLDRLFFGRAEISVALEPAAAGGRTRVTCEHRLWGRGAAGRVYASTVMRPFLRANVQSIVDSLAAACA